MTPSSTPLHARILSGAGRYQDPWHPFARTSARLAELLDEAGFTASVEEDVDRGFADLRGVDLLVCNFGAPREAAPEDERSRQGLLEYLSRGAPLLALHVVATSLPSVPEWEAILGGIWVRGTTMHPPLDLAHIHVHADRHAIVAPVRDFDVEDERYTHLRVAPDLVPLAGHLEAGAEQPLLWARHYRGAPVVFDALGHDERSYAAPEHREIVRRAARWLVGRLD